MSTLLRAFQVAKGEEGGQPCSLLALGAITFGGALVAASGLALILSIGGGR